MRSWRRWVRKVLSPAADGVEAVQDMYLSRPDAAVSYGSDEPDLTLVDDRPQRDPGDLRG